MNERAVARPQEIAGLTNTAARSHLLLRRRVCGATPGLDIEGAGCHQTRLGLQRPYTNRVDPATVPPIVHDVLNSPGRPLEPDTSAFMESRFGHDFSKVRVHTDARAAESAQAVNAMAYTVGRDVVFGSGQYKPKTAEGRRLLAHELTHVVQQRHKDAATTAPASTRQQREASVTNELSIGQSDAEHERTAETVAQSVVRGRQVPSISSSTVEAHVQRAGFGELRAAEGGSPAVDFVDFRTSGDTQSPAIRTQLGTNPSGMLNNAQETVYRVTSRAFSYQQYRLRRTIEEQIWQQVGDRWLLMQTAPSGTSDDPDPANVWTTPPLIYSFDSPGWSWFTPKNSNLSVGDTKTSPSATQVVVQQNFSEWVEGQNVNGGWRRASLVVFWHNVLWLQRSGPAADWRPTPATEIKLGHIKLGQPGGGPSQQTPTAQE